MEFLISHLNFIWLYLLPFLIVLTILVFVHEWGHYIVARMCGVKVDIFSIGFGKEIFGYTAKNGTRWKFSMIPLGGYVKMYGDMDAASTPAKIEAIPAEERAYAFPCKTVGQRSAVVAAGPVANFILAILIYAGMFMIWGQPYTATVVESVSESSAAAEAGVQVGDKILAIDGGSITRFEDVQRIVQIGMGAPMVLTLQRAGTPVNLTVTPKIVEVEDLFGGKHLIPRLGIGSTQRVYEKRGPVDALGQAVIESYEMGVATLKALWQIVTGVRSTKELGGPLRIAQLSGQAAQVDIPALVGLLAILSINLGLINLFPIPLLDGGHLLFYGAEALRGRPPSEKFMNASAMVGVAVVGSLMLFALFNDLAHFRVFDYVKNLFS